jgi:pimeloyl-ACP methyl ester carboxylesterase
MAEGMDALRLHVERRGSGPPLVLTHGGVGSWKHWVRNVGPLSEHFTVYAFDLPGFGRSPSIDRTADRDAYLRYCLDGIRAALPEDGPVYLAGFSFGSVVGAHVAVHLGDRTARLSLISPGGVKSIRAAEPEYEKMPPEGTPEAERRAVVRRNLLKLMLHHPESADDEAVDIQSENIRLTRYPSVRVSRGDYLLDDLRRIRCPMQIVLGEFDTVIYPSHTHRLSHIRTAAPDFRVDIIPGAGHWMQFERAEAVNRVLIDFLTGEG